MICRRSSGERRNMVSSSGPVTPVSSISIIDNKPVTATCSRAEGARQDLLGDRPHDERREAQHQQRHRLVGHVERDRPQADRDQAAGDVEGHASSTRCGATTASRASRWTPSASPHAAPSRWAAGRPPAARRSGSGPPAMPKMPERKAVPIISRIGRGHECRHGGNARPAYPVFKYMVNAMSILIVSMPHGTAPPPLFRRRRP